MADIPAVSSEETVAAQLRGAARWLIASFGAIAAVVAAGIQFGEVGKISGGDLTVALIAAAGAFAGIGVAMWAVMRLLVPRARSITELAAADSSDPAVSYIAETPEILQGFVSIRSLDEARRQDQRVYHAALMQWRENVDAASAKIVKNAAAVLAPTDAIADEVVFWANYQTLKRDFNRALVRRILPGVALAAAGLTVFAIKVSEEPASPLSARLSDAALRNAVLPGSDLHQADLKDANFAGANLSDSDLSEADLNGAKLDGADLTGVNLTDASIDAKTDLEGVTWRDTVCPDGVNSDTADATCAAHLHPQSREK